MPEGCEGPWDTLSINSRWSTSTHEISEDEAEETTPPIQIDLPKEGKFGDLLKEQLDQARSTTTQLAPPIDENLAKLINMFAGDTKSTETLHTMAKPYRRPENLPLWQIPKVETEILAAADTKEKAGDTALVAIQKGLVTAMAAMLPVAKVMLDREKMTRRSTI